MPKQKQPEVKPLPAKTPPPEPEAKPLPLPVSALREQAEIEDGEIPAIFTCSDNHDTKGAKGKPAPKCKVGTCKAAEGPKMTGYFVRTQKGEKWIAAE